jgi:hypothetical protein
LPSAGRFVADCSILVSLRSPAIWNNPAFRVFSFRTEKEREMANVKNLRTGFTGELNDTSGVTAKAKKAANYVSDEASAVVQSAQDHPSATSTALLVFGAAAFVAGYLIGSASNGASTRRSYW